MDTDADADTEMNMVTDTAAEIPIVEVFSFYTWISVTGKWWGRAF